MVSAGAGAGADAYAGTTELESLCALVPTSLAISADAAYMTGHRNRDGVARPRSDGPAKGNGYMVNGSNNGYV